MVKKILLFLAVLTAFNLQAVTFKGEPISGTSNCRIVGIAEDHASVNGDLNIPMSLYINGRVYQVTEIASGALNDFPNVTRILLPGSVTNIGGLTESFKKGPLYNFFGCPKLKEFYVASNNPMFSHNSQGLLLKTDGKDLVRCPQAVSTENGTLKVGGNVNAICEEAFSEVTTVVRLEIEYLRAVSYNGGLNSCVNLASIRINNDVFLHTNDDVLIDHTGVLMCFPPKKVLGSYTMPAEVTEIYDFAFANTMYLSTVIFNNNVKKIGPYAFYKANLATVNLSSSVETVEPFAFSEMPRLTTIVTRGDLTELPAGFAAGCPNLTTLNFQKTQPSKLGNGAFKNCTSLADYKFSAATLMGDSVFYNTGFTEVVYGSEAPVQEAARNGYYIFADCKKLARINLSAINCENGQFTLPGKFAPGCPNLTEVEMARNTYIRMPNQFTENWYTFGESCALKKIIMYSFECETFRPAFHWGKGGTAKPNIYILRNGLGADAPAPTDKLCAGDQYTTVKPIYYYESVRPAPSYSTGNATFYIPGGAMEFFSEALDAGAYVEEFYRFNPGTEPDG
ncbi:MAG: leucine-rich repeat domain-containing protein, partial [Muribaculaceae bacterium]|nr:leucine-rich repeat domain-containing protein [Muribaculaceae bacterium]